MAIVVLQGPSGAGKTYLAKKLSADTGIPYIGKDTIKEFLFDTVGYPVDREESRAYGRIAIGTIFATMAEFQVTGRPLIVDCALHIDEAVDDLSRHNIDTKSILQLYLLADPKVLMERFNTRLINKERHPGHGDSIKDDEMVFREYIKKYQPLSIANTITVDTVKLDKGVYSVLKDRVARFLQSGV